MKQIKTYLKLLFFITLFWSCQKSGNISDFSNLGIGSYLKLVQKVNEIMDATNAASTVSIKVSGYGTAPEKIKIYVTANVKTANKSSWKQIKELPYNGETTLQVSNAEIVKALGTTIQPGVTYWLYNEITTKDGKVHSFANTFGEFESNPNYNMALTWKAVAVCPFDAAAASGIYNITTDGWDGAVGQQANVTASGDIVTITYLFPYAANPGKNPVNIKVNVQTGSATVSSQIYGSYGSAFQNFTCEGTGFVFACTGVIDLNLTHKLGATNYGTYRIVLKK